MTCPHCGSALKVFADRQKAFCQFCDLAFDGCDNIKITVAKDSYAEKYFKENKIKYIIEVAFDWLKE